MKYTDDYNVIAKISNVPESALECKYWVVRLYEGNLWYYGAFKDDRKRAEKMAFECDGMILERKCA